MSYRDAVAKADLRQIAAEYKTLRSDLKASRSGFDTELWRLGLTSKTARFTSSPLGSFSKDQHIGSARGEAVYSLPLPSFSSFYLFSFISHLQRNLSFVSEVIESDRTFGTRTTQRLVSGLYLLEATASITY